jgi:RNA polymerase sigma-70 factor (ECF subfamily)
MSELSPESRALIELVGDRDGPSPEHSARLSQKVGQSLLAAGATVGLAKGAAGALTSAGLVGTKAAVGTSLTALKCAAWFAAGIGAGLVVAAPVAVWTHSRPEQGGTVASAKSPVPLPRSGRGGEPMREAALSAPSTTGASPSTAARELPIAEPSPSGGAPVAAFAGTVSEEMRLLGAAQRELSARRGDEALRLLEEHARKFPEGALGEERLAVRVLALCDLGRVAEARQATRDFLSRFPVSPLVPRIRESCGQVAGQPGRTPTAGFSEMGPPGSRD